MESALTRDSLNKMETSRQIRNHLVYYRAPLKKSIFLYLIKLWMAHVNNQHSPSKDVITHKFDNPHKRPERPDLHHTLLRKDNIIYALADLDLINIGKPVSAYKAPITIGDQGIFICEAVLKHTDFISSSWNARKAADRGIDIFGPITVLFVLIGFLDLWEVHSMNPNPLDQSSLNLIWIVAGILALFTAGLAVAELYYTTQKLYKPNLIDRTTLLHSIKRRNLSDKDVKRYNQIVTSPKCNVLFDTQSKYLRGDKL